MVSPPSPNHPTIGELIKEIAEYAEVIGISALADANMRKLITVGMTGTIEAWFWSPLRSNDQLQAVVILEDRVVVMYILSSGVTLRTLTPSNVKFVQIDLVVPETVVRREDLIVGLTIFCQDQDDIQMMARRGELHRLTRFYRLLSRRFGGSK